MKKPFEPTGVGARGLPLVVSLAVVLIALSARLAYQWFVVGMETPPVDDAVQYDEIARSLASGGPFLTGEGARSTRAPAFPMLLAGVYTVTGQNLTAARILQAILGAATSLLILHVGVTLAGASAGIAAGLFHALFPHSIVWSGVLLSEPLCGLVALAATAALLRAAQAPEFALWGGLCALTALCRPNMALMFPLGLMWILLRPDGRTKAVAVSTVAFLAVLLPWTVRNYLVHGRLVPITTMGGVVLWEGNNPYVAADPQLRGRSINSDTLPEAGVARGLPEAERDSYYFNLAIEYSKSHWRELPPLIFAKFRRLVNVVPNVGGPWERIAASSMLVMLFAAFVMGAIVAWRHGAMWLWPLLMPVCTVLVTGLVYWSDARVRAPAEPELILVAACGLSSLRRPLRAS